MPTNLDTTNSWLAVMAIATVVQTVLLIGIAIAAWVAMTRATEAIRQIEERHLLPLGARVHAVADDVQEVITRVRRADDAVRSQLTRLDSAAHVAGHAIGTKVWPVVGIGRAVAAAVRAFSSGSGSSSSPSPGTPRVARVPTR
jgi:hypothetical protein